MPGSSKSRAQALAELRGQALGCTRCPKLVATRTQVVFGGGPVDATLMVVGEAPGAAEDRLGVPLAGPAGELLDELLASIGLRRDEISVVNVLNCRPPDNRNPLPGELESCREYLVGQVQLTQPVLVCSLGTFATRVLRGRPGPITALRGEDEVVRVGTRAVRLLPLVHPAAALYTAAAVEQLRADVARIPGLLALGAPDQPEPEPEVVPAPEAAAVLQPRPAAPEPRPAPETPASPKTETETGPEPVRSAPSKPATAPPAAQLHLF